MTSVTSTEPGQTVNFTRHTRMFLSFTHVAVRLLDWTAATLGRTPEMVASQRTGRRGEEDAYFYLSRLGYVMVARNYRSPRRRGEIDLIGWDNDVLCFIEVKTRTRHDLKSAEAAVDRHKRKEVAAVAREYLRYLPRPCHCRFDVVSVYYESHPSQPRFELFRNVQPLA